MKGAPYNTLLIHRSLLLDRVRCSAFQAALASVVKPEDTVLDVGAGTGILSIFAAQAGARKVYAVERTRIAHTATAVVEANGLSDRVEVIQGEMEAVDLPSQVDVIVSEWLGGFGVDELLIPVLIARDRWLKHGGTLVPNLVTAWMAPAWDVDIASVMQFLGNDPYGVRLDLLSHHTAEEVFYGRHHIGQNELRAEPTPLWRTDVLAYSLEEAKRPYEASVSFEINRPGRLNGLALWFTAELAPGISLTCAPEGPLTHWGRTICPFKRSIDAKLGTTVDVRFTCEPDNRGWSWSRWSVRVDHGEWEHHDQRKALV